MIKADSIPVKLMVRHAGRGKFLSATGRWTRKAEAALNFPNVLNAIHTCLARSLHEVELIFRFEGDRADRCLRVKIA